MTTNILHNQTENILMPGFINAGSEIDILKASFRFRGKTVVDVGCGTGRISRLIASLGASVIGIDAPELINLAEKQPVTENILFKTGTGQNLPVESNYADIIIYFASFHHVPEVEMNAALNECHRVLKEDGLLCFCEPLTDKGSYYDLTGLVEDEREIREIAYAYISFAGETDFHMVAELYYYMERSFEDFRNLVNIYVSDQKQREDILYRAKEIVLQTNPDIDSARFRSLARMNILQKNANL